MNKQVAATLLAFATGCAADSDGAFHLEGRLAEPSRVTHVVATDASSGNRVVAEMRADGEFDLALAPGGQWIVTFADARKTGKAMQVATLQAGALDAFAPQGPGGIDLGVVQLGTARGTSAVQWPELIDALGIDQATATRMGRTDNLALRYANPDVDNDGVIDALQGRWYRLSLSGDYKLTTAGRDATMADLAAGSYANAGMRYIGTNIAAAVPRAMNMNMESGTLTFEQAFYGSAQGVDTAKIEAGTAIGQPHIKFGELAGSSMIGVVARSGYNAPSGTYEFGFANGQLTFSDVNVPSAASLDSGQDFAVPFIHLRPTVAGCTVDCEIAAVELDWRRQTANGWQSTAAPNTAHVDVVAKIKGASTQLAVDLAGTTSVAWNEMPVKGSNLTRNELGYLTIASLCYFAVSYPSDFGMQLTTAVANPTCY